MYLTLLLLSIASRTLAQNCDNYGTVNGSACACPPGFGGDECQSPGCGGTIFQGSERPLASTSTGGSSNLTASSCSCESGWTGVGCNVCQNANACQTGYSSVNNVTPSPFNDGQNRTLTCNTTPTVWSSGQMSCSVDNPTLKALYPLSSTLNIVRTLDSSLSPIPSSTSLHENGTAFASLFYEGVEQFFCYADSCVQSQSADNSTNDWACKNLKCTCRPGTLFCGGVPTSDLTNIINRLGGDLGVSCSIQDPGKCAFKQDVIRSVFGSGGLQMTGCQFGECVRQNVIDNKGSLVPTQEESGGSELSGGVIAGLAVVGSLVALALAFLAWGFMSQRKARKSTSSRQMGGYGVEWNQVSYAIPTKKKGNSDKVVLDELTGSIKPGELVAILGPSGAGKTTLVEILAGRNKSGVITGSVTYTSSSSDEVKSSPRIGFVPQQDVLPPLLTVFETLMFAANLRLPESLTPPEKVQRVERLMEKLGIAHIRDSRIGGEKRGISGGEMRRVSIGVELIAAPEVLILDEPTSGLDSVSAAKVGNVLHSIAHDPEHPTAVIASIHQPSSHLYQTFDTCIVLSHGRSIYYGPGSLAPVDHFTELHSRGIPVALYPQGYNVADYLLEVASDPPVGLFGLSRSSGSSHTEQVTEKQGGGALEKPARASTPKRTYSVASQEYATTFLTQFEALSWREWKLLRRDYTLLVTHVGVACVLGVFCGGLYYKIDLTIAGFQSRVGCLFFIGALIAFSSLSALYRMVETRTLFLRERSSSYYSPTAWLLSRFVFDVVPLRILPTIIVSTITYWMVGLAGDAAHFFKFLFIVVLYTLAMTLFNFLLGALFDNGGIAILLSALTTLYQMTFAGFFVNLSSIPPVLRWLQWFCVLKYTLEALAVNEVGSGLPIQDTLEGVPVNVQASLIMKMLFGFGENNYYRDVLVLFAFIAGFGIAVIGVVWFKVRERR